MTSDQQRDRLDELEDRVQALEDIFSPNIRSRQTAHVDATKQDARNKLEEGDIKTIKIVDPPGEGDAPESGVGKANGIVTFVNCDGLNITEGDAVECRITKVTSNAANGIATQKVSN